MKVLKVLGGILCWVAVVAIGVGFGIMLFTAMEGQHTAARQQGAAAGKHGVPAESNPYKGRYGQDWLEGWMDAKEKNK